MLIPERTVDSLLAFELLHAIPTAIIWSPTNTIGSLDHALHQGGRAALLFECKGIGDRGQVTVRGGQLSDYITRGLGHILYVFPALPPDETEPWSVPCNCPPSRGRCLSCGPVRGVDARRSSDRDPSVATAPLARRIQPWFDHWAWCISAARLSAHLGAPSGNVNMSSDDASMQSMAGADRLCHLLTNPTPPPVAGQQDGDASSSDGRDPSAGGSNPFPDGGGPSGNGGPLDPSDSNTPSPTSISDLPIAEYRLELTDIEGFWEYGADDGEHRTRPGSVGLIF